MAETDPQGQQPGGAPTPSPSEAPPAAAVARMQRFTAANMVRSLLPLVVICLVLVGWSALKYDGGDHVREVDPSGTERAVAGLAGYQVLVPRDLPEGWRATSVRTDAGQASPGDPVTLQIGWYTPGEEYAAYVISDDPGASALTDVLDDATAQGTEQVAGQSWQRLTTERGETALTRTAGPATLLVTGSASEEELETLAGSLQPAA